MNLKKLYEKIDCNKLSTKDIIRWFQSDASEFLKLEGVFEEYLAKYRSKYFKHEEGTDRWELNKEGVQTLIERKDKQ